MKKIEKENPGNSRLPGPSFEVPYTTELLGLFVLALREALGHGVRDDASHSDADGDQRGARAQSDLGGQFLSGELGDGGVHVDFLSVWGFLL